MVLKVSIFLANKMQLANGRFVLPHGGSVASEFEIPGTIRFVLPPPYKYMQ